MKKSIISRKNLFLLLGIFLLGIAISFSNIANALTLNQVMQRSPAFHLLKDIYTVINGEYIPINTSTGKINSSLIEITEDLNMKGYDINNAGKIGIGTANPSEKLHVVGKIRADNVIYSMSDPTYTPPTQLRTWGINKPDKNFYIEWGNSADDKMYITDHWKYISPLYVKTGPIHLMAGNKYGIFVNTNGNIGIGATSPSAKLDVNGNAKIRGDLDMSNKRITNLAMPIASSDAATKGYVDAQVGGGPIFWVTSDCKGACICSYSWPDWPQLNVPPCPSGYIEVGYYDKDNPPKEGFIVNGCGIADAELKSPPYSSYQGHYWWRDAYADVSICGGVFNYVRVKIGSECSMPHCRAHCAYRLCMKE